MKIEKDKIKLKDRAVFKFIQDKAAPLLGETLNVIGEITGKEGLAALGNTIKGTKKVIPTEVVQRTTEMIEAENAEIDMYLKDVQDARSREVELAKAGKKDYMMAVTGVIGLGLLVFLAVSIVFIPSVNDNKLLIHLLGITEGIGLSIFSYYFGSSKGSKDKTNLLGKK